ncbi:hypothetical protein BaRGS_00031254 [Batillaria attramentaria]|uniref:BPTI/Kunitz inhibitor domain-containing protein n=1 Tax=Batillaria attramentaria TaxID=370345 RepID=A0ABD0JS51_9CAEN
MNMIVVFILATLLVTCQARCVEEPEQGPCEGLFPRYFFNPATRNCEEFTYGGCQGNDNNFLSLRECVITCMIV